MRFPQLVSNRYLWSRQKEAFISILTIISILGVAVGVAVLNIVMAIMTGFEHELKERLVGTNSHIVVRALSGTLYGWKELRSEIERVEGVESVSAFTYSQALIRAGSQSSGILLRGIEPQSAGEQQLRKFMQPDVGTGEIFKSAVDGVDAVQLPGLVVGEEMMKTFGFNLGDVVSLLAPQVQSSPFGLIPRYKRFEIIGSYSSGLIEYESSIAYAAISDTQQFFRLEDGVSGLEVRVSNIDHAPRISGLIVDQIGGLSRGIYAQDWTQTNRALWEALKLEKLAYFIVLLLIIVMASFSIVSTLIMIVLEKRKDICILRTMGASASQIGALFRRQGAIIGAVGTASGLVLGLLGCLALREYGFPLPEKIFPVSTLPVKIESMNFVYTGVAAFLICLLATIYPAWRASQIRPVDGLRYE